MLLRSRINGSAFKVEAVIVATVEAYSDSDFKETIDPYSHGLLVTLSDGYDKTTGIVFKGTEAECHAALDTLIRVTQYPFHAGNAYDASRSWHTLPSSTIKEALEMEQDDDDYYDEPYTVPENEDPEEILGGN